MLKEGKIVDEGEKNKIGEKFKEIQQSDKVRQAQNLGLGASKANLFTSVKAQKREPESEFIFSADLKNSEISQMLKEWKNLLAIVVIFYMANTCGYSKIFMFRYFTLILYQMGDEQDLGVLINYSIVFAIYFVCFPIFEFLLRNLMWKGISRMVHAKMIYRLLMTPPSTMLGSTSLIMKEARDATELPHVDQKLPDYITTVVFAVSYMLAILSILYIIGTNFFVLMYIGSMALTFYLVIRNSNNRQIYTEMNQYIKSKWITLNQDVFHGLSIIRACNYTLFFRMKISYLEERKNMSRLYLIGSQYRSELLNYLFVMVFGIVPLLGFAYHYFTFQSHIPCLSLYFVFTYYLPILYNDAFSAFIGGVDSFTQATRALSLSKDRFDATRTTEEQVIQKPIDQRVSDVYQAADKGEVLKVLEFHKVTVAPADLNVSSNTAGSAVTNNSLMQEPIVKELSLSIGIKEKVAIVADKVSCVKLLSRLILRFYDNYTGRIEFLGKNIQAVRAGLTRQRIFYLDYECGLFAGTLAENLLPGGESLLSGKREMEVIAMLQNFGFSPDEFANEKLELWIDPTKLESVDKLILGLVRCQIEVMLSQPKPSLVILDNVDSRFTVETYTRMKTLIERELHNTAVLMICSIPKVALLMETCIVMKCNQVIEKGRVAELDKNPKSEYSRLIAEDILSN